MPSPYERAKQQTVVGCKWNGAMQEFANEGLKSWTEPVGFVTHRQTERATSGLPAEKYS